MIIITSNTQLLQLIPNVVETVEGEKPLFDKLSTQLAITEQWLSDTLLGDDMANSIAANPASQGWLLAATVIANEAFRRSVPSLDLILTANGFGVVSNSNVAPASKERIERLMASLGDQRDKAMTALLDMLKQDSTWLQSAQGQWLTSSFFMRPVEDTAAAKLALKNDDRWEAFLELREKALPVEQAIAENWLGQTLTARLRATLATTPNSPSDTATLARTVRQLIINELISCKRPVKNLDRLVNYIRNNASLYPEWQSDPVAELFEEKWRFQNKKESAGYFF